MCFHVALEYFSQELFRTFSSCNLSLIHCRVNVYSFSFAYFLNSQARSVPLSTQMYLGHFFLILVKKAQTVSLESFVFTLFATNVLPDRSWRATRCYTPLILLANLSPYAWSLHQFSVLNPSFTWFYTWGNKVSVRSFWMQKLSHLWYWEFDSFH